jgi:hypothetical protein
LRRIGRTGFPARDQATSLSCAGFRRAQQLAVITLRAPAAM